jgi:hypothetical protein
MKRLRYWVCLAGLSTTWPRPLGQFLATELAAAYLSRRQTFLPILSLVGRFNTVLQSPNYLLFGLPPLDCPERNPNWKRHFENMASCREQCPGNNQMSDLDPETDYGDLMTLGDIAEMHKCSVRHARDVIVKTAGFPDPSPTSRIKHKLWVTEEVRAFVTRQSLRKDPQ